MKNILAGLIFLMVMVLFPVEPGTAEAAKHQLLGGIIIRQATGEAQLSLDTVDAGPFHHVTAKQIKRGITLRDDMGRSISFKATATLNRQAKSFQVFNLTGLTLVKHGQVIRVTHLFVGLFTGTDFEHWYDDGSVCSSPQLSIEACLSQWTH